MQGYRMTAGFVRELGEDFDDAFGPIAKTTEADDAAIFKLGGDAADAVRQRLGYAVGQVTWNCRT
jgi:hypothetical protein